MVLQMIGARDKVLRAARSYQRLADLHSALEVRLGQVEERLRDDYASLRDAAPKAFAECTDTTGWEDLYAAIGQAADDTDILTAIPLPRPGDGSWPPSLDGRAEGRE